MKEELKIKLDEFIKNKGVIDLFDPEKINPELASEFKTLDELKEFLEEEWFDSIILRCDEVANDLFYDFASDHCDYEDEVIDYFLDEELYCESRSSVGTYDEDIDDKFSNELRELYDIHEYIRENMNVDAVSNSIEATKLNLNIMPNQRENLNTEGLYFVNLFKAMLDRDVDDIKKAKKELKENVIEDLFKSQGYELVDICDDEKINESEFLSTFYAELFNLRIDAGGFLVFLTELDLKDYYRLLNNEISINFERGTCGIFDPIFGGGSILELALERPVEIKAFTKDKNDRFYDSWIQIEDGKCYGYSLQSIYSLNNDCYEDAAIVIIEK